MFLRTVKVRRKTHTLEYVQLVQNNRDPETKTSKTNILYNFGRIDKIDLASIRRLIGSLSTLLEPEEISKIRDKINPDNNIKFLGARQLGGSWFMDCLWKQLEIDKTLNQLLKQRNYQTPIERLIFSMVSNRALEPYSKLGIEDWVKDIVWIRDLPEVEVHQLYRAMDFLLEASDEIQHDIFFKVADLFNLEVDLIFLDTTTTYFEVETEDEYTEAGIALRKRGYSKDNHPELTQIVIAFAVTRNGLPVRCWTWPGNTSDQSIVEQVKNDLCNWSLGRVIMVQDTGFNSDRNKRILQRAGGHYIIGEKLRSGPKAYPVEAVARGGKYQTLSNGLKCKEVIVGGDSAVRKRYVVVQNPDQAKRDRKKRDDIVAEAERRLEDLSQLSGKAHEKGACELRSHGVYGRYIRQSKTGKLFLNKEKIKQEEEFDGKFLVSTSDDFMKVEDIVMGYKQLFEIERVFRDMKHLVDIRPVYHRLADRIKSHVLLCWLAMMLIRLSENETGENWHQMKKTFCGLQIGIHEVDQNEVWNTNPVSLNMKKLLDKMKMPMPSRILHIKQMKKP